MSENERKIFGKIPEITCDILIPDEDDIWKIHFDCHLLKKDGNEFHNTYDIIRWDNSLRGELRAWEQKIMLAKTENMRVSCKEKIENNLFVLECKKIYSIEDFMEEFGDVE